MHLLSSRILMSMGMIVFVGALAVGATGAFFSDTESSTGNTFAAGALDLTIDNSSYGFDWNDPTNQSPAGVWGENEANSWTLRDLDTCGPNSNQSCLFFNFADLKPGDYGEDTISLHVQNNAWACMAFDLTATPENSLNEPEQDAGDVGPANGDNGELQDYLSFIFWRDDGDNVLEDDEDVIEALSGLPGSAFTGEWLAIAEGGLDPDVPLQGGADPSYIAKGWCFGSMVATPVTQDDLNNVPPDADTNRIGFTCSGVGNHNDAQTDGIVVDVHFYGVQSRNNGDFQCSSLPPVNPPPAPLAQCQDGIDNADSEDVLIDAADPGCHSDGNAINSQSYVPTDNDETDVPGTLTINKIVVNDPIVGPPTGTAAVTDFEFQVDAGLATAFEGDGSNAISVAAGAHTVVEVPELNYTTTYTNSLNANADCNALVVPSAGNVTCTITNSFIDESAPQLPPE